MKYERIFGESRYSHEMWKTIPVALLLLGYLTYTTAQKVETRNIEDLDSEQYVTEPLNSIDMLRIQYLGDTEEPQTINVYQYPQQEDDNKPF